MRILRRRSWRRHHWNHLTRRGRIIVIVLASGMAVLMLALASEAHP